jgi:hypothetical protein
MPVIAVSLICPGFSAFSGFLHEADNRTLHPMRKVLRTKCRKGAVSFWLLAVSQTQKSLMETWGKMYGAGSAPSAYSSAFSAV